MSFDLRADRRRIIAHCGAALTLVLGGAWVARTCGIWFNVTTSLPPGVYRESRGEPLTRGAVVIACLPPAVAAVGRARAYLVKGQRCIGGVAPVGKVALALAGDTVDVRSDGLEVNGVHIRHSAQLTRDGAGRPLPRIGIGRYTVRPGEFWIFSSYSGRSWDSRYYGAIPTSSVLSVVRPLLTIGRLPDAAPR